MEVDERSLPSPEGWEGKVAFRVGSVFRAHFIK